nr:unnamed protein product [Haemonchus contortus]
MRGLQAFGRNIGADRVTLTEDQKDAVRVGSGRLPIVAIQAAYGTGKTLVGALIAALSSQTPDTTVIVTTSTNAAVAQFAETLLSLGDFPNLNVVRHISDTAASSNLTPTAVDLNKVLKGLGAAFGHLLDAEDREACQRFTQCRQLLEDYLENPDRVPEMSDDDKEEYEIAEQFVSQTIKRMVRILFTVNPPSVLCLTTSSLLNSTGSRGIFSQYVTNFKVIIGDEDSQIPEPALLTIAARLQGRTARVHW